MNSNLYVVTAISNPVRYRTSYNLYRDFARMVERAGAILYTVEVAFGERPFSVTDLNNPNHLQLRTNSEIWHKENMLNQGIERLPRDWRYVSWCFTAHSKMNMNYHQEVARWQERAEKFIKRDIGYVPSLLLHYWNGKKRDRRYKERWQILLDNNFDPRIDLKEDWQGLWQLTDRNPKLRDDIRAYFRSRNEDSVDMEENEVKL